MGVGSTVGVGVGSTVGVGVGCVVGVGVSRSEQATPPTVTIAKPKISKAKRSVRDCIVLASSVSRNVPITCS